MFPLETFMYWVIPLALLLAVNYKIATYYRLRGVDWVEITLNLAIIDIMVILMIWMARASS